MQSRIHLIHEVNCYVSKPKLLDRIKLHLGLVNSVQMLGFGSVWIAADPYGPEDDYEQVATRVVGPIPAEEARDLIANLREIFTRAGVNVVEETVVDD